MSPWLITLLLGQPLARLPEHLDGNQEVYPNTIWSLLSQNQGLTRETLDSISVIVVNLVAHETSLHNTSQQVAENFVLNLKEFQGADQVENRVPNQIPELVVARCQMLC